MANVFTKSYHPGVAGKSFVEEGVQDLKPVFHRAVIFIHRGDCRNTQGRLRGFTVQMGVVMGAAFLLNLAYPLEQLVPRRFLEAYGMAKQPAGMDQNFADQLVAGPKDLLFEGCGNQVLIGKPFDHGFQGGKPLLNGRLERFPGPVAAVSRRFFGFGVDRLDFFCRGDAFGEYPLLHAHNAVVFLFPSQALFAFIPFVRPGGGMPLGLGDFLDVKDRRAVGLAHGIYPFRSGSEMLPFVVCNSTGMEMP